MENSNRTIIDSVETLEAALARVKAAQSEFAKFTQEQVDKIFLAAATAANKARIPLAKMAVEETGMGVVEDKVIKNNYAAEYIYNAYRHTRTCGVIEEDKAYGIKKIAEPIGVIAAVIPTTNPTSTAIFKCLIALKTRNAIIISPHPRAKGCTAAAAKIVLDAAVAAGAPEGIIEWIDVPGLELTNLLMKEADIILATGGPGMVKAAYSSGKPALGVGAGNTPAIIDDTADIILAVNSIIHSKTFDNGMICASEQAVIVEKELQSAFEKYMKANNCYFLNEDEIRKLTAYAFPEGKTSVNPDLVGKTANWIAEQAGLSVPADTKILIAKLKGVGENYPLSKEKLSPILAYYIVKDEKEGFTRAKEMLHNGGLGHSAAIHSTNDEIIAAYGEAMEVGRIIVNSPSSQGGIGDIYNENTPSLTLGCGSFGKNSTTSNVSAMNLVNVKRIAKRRINMQWFKVPPKIYFEYNAIQYLEKMPNISRAFIVTDEMMVKLGNVDKILHYLRKRTEYCHAEIFADVEPDPSVETIMRGVEMMRNFKPDVIIALGGGSAMDAAKGMWLFYEHPEASFEGLRQKFFDIRKRAYHFPKLGTKAQMVSIPTTSGTGSEVTSFAVITDKKKNIKYPLADYELTPDVAIVDPQFVLSVPKSVTADTGLDVLTHAIEAYVSVLASDYTDGLALHAIRLVFKYLKRAYDNGNDREAREKMHNASCIAGMAFTNAFLGINHSLAHKLGSAYHIPHGRANAILLPYVIEYNAQKPKKFATWPKYQKFIADVRYAEIAEMLGLPCSTTEEGVQSLIKAVRDLEASVNEVRSVKECGIDEKVYMDSLDDLADEAHEDQCTPANPRYPLISELKELYIKAYYGEEK